MFSDGDGDLTFLQTLNRTGAPRQTFKRGYERKRAYGRPFLCQPGGAIERVARLQDRRLGRVETLPLFCGGDVSLHVLLHAGHGATLDAAAAGGGASRPGTALPASRVKDEGGSVDALMHAVCLCLGFISQRASTYRGRGW